MTNPARARHQEIVEFLQSLLPTYVKLHALGRVVAPPFQMKLAASGRERISSFSRLSTATG